MEKRFLYSFEGIILSITQLKKCEPNDIDEIILEIDSDSEHLDSDFPWIFIPKPEDETYQRGDRVVVNAYKTLQEIETLTPTEIRILNEYYKGNIPQLVPQEVYEVKCLEQIKMR